MIEVKSRWLERDRDDMMEWLERNGYGQGTRSRASSNVFNRMRGLVAV
jgi:hypothetical protein